MTAPSDNSPPPLPPLFGRAVAAIHCVGVAGMGLGPLAIYLARLGFEVSGEDDHMNGVMHAQLERAGIALTPTGGLPGRCELVACSSAVRDGHPTVGAARARGLPVVRRGELLAEIARGKKLVAICGSHGKTTTTAMLVTVLRRAGFPAGYVLGGLFDDDTPPAAAARQQQPANEKRIRNTEKCPGADPHSPFPISPSSFAAGEAAAAGWLVAEIDESDGTIENFSPEITVAGNLDWDHPDHYRDPAAIEAAFAGIFGRTRGAVLLGANAFAGGVRLRQPLRESVVTFGPGADFDFRVENESPDNGRQTLALGGRFPIAAATVRALGAFNAANAAAALAAAHLMGAPLAPELLAAFPGVRRRQSVLLANSELTVIEDYAHHPAEISALLASLRARIAGNGRLVAVFQPHRHSRTARFKADFAAALALADRVCLIDVYPAGEPPQEGGHAIDVYRELRRAAPAPPVLYCNGKTDAMLAALARSVAPGDWVAFVGAGDIDRRAREWLVLADEYRRVANRWATIAVALRGSVSVETKVRHEEPLAPRTTLRAGGAARIYAEPAGEADLRALLREARARALDVFPLGRGSNLIVPDEGVDGLVISLAHPSWQAFEPRGDGGIWAGAGVRLKNLCGLAAKAGLGGFEFLDGIPGSLGGALRMNAGAMGAWTFDVVERVRLMTRDGEVREVPRAELHAGYRHCAELRDGGIALGALLRPSAARPAEDIARRLDAYRDKRRESQPREPSAGCVFKNPEGAAAGRLIDECGLKGECVGGAEVSAVHANFIVNRGGATATDIIELTRIVRARVAEKTGVTLEPEVILYGKEWGEVL
ncbi:MAG: UDP-N-acetylmuramate dehydrogenase [Opitutaceae bacterium]|jgi:UDP-N-acetylenolpyruvoylglucosamine reductase|nr:UDP-N-acetylmuramate dehydrogenase [Opitutaceae bacterium]